MTDESGHRDRYGETGEAELVRRVYETTPLIMFATEGPEHRIVASNAAFRAGTGRDQLLGRTVAEAFPEVAGQQLYELYTRVYRSGLPQSAREWHIQVDLQGDGSLSDLYYDFNVSPRHGDDGTVIGTQLCSIDVTERVRERQVAQRRLDHAEAQAAQAHEVMTALQRVLLPAGLPVLPTVQLAATYLLAQTDTTAGGDWFDAITLPNDRIALVVGDVVGHGITASATMGQLRAVLHHHLTEGGQIAAALAALDRFARTVSGGEAATVCVAVLDLRDGSLSYCTAGHPPPLLIRADASTHYLPATGSGPLGSGMPFVVAEASLGEQETLLFFSDGVVERPGRDHADSLVELAQVAADASADRILKDSGESAVQRVCTQTLELLVRATGHSDDITLLAAQRIAPVAPLQVDLRADLDAVQTVHQHLAEWLRRNGVGPRDITRVRQVVGELVTNSAVHAYRTEPEPGPVSVYASLQPDGVLVVAVRDEGCWHDHPPHLDLDVVGGLGLVIADRMSDGLHLRHGDGGTIAAVHYALTTPARLHTAAEISSGTHSVEEVEHELLLIIDQPDAPQSVRVDGPVTAATVDQLDLALQRLTRNGTRPLTVDLTGATVLASAGVATLQRAIQRSQRHDSELRLRTPPGTVAQQVLTVAALPHHTTDPDARLPSMG